MDDVFEQQYREGWENEKWDGVESGVDFPLLADFAMFTKCRLEGVRL